MNYIICVCVIFLHVMQDCDGVKPILYPRASETREVLSLDGLWYFVKSPVNDPLLGHRQKWFTSKLCKVRQHNIEVMRMPVPSSYNDITQDATLRDHVGLVWYDRTFFVPKEWSVNKKVWVRFSSVNYAAEVWINSNLVVTHKIGHLPFQADINKFLKFGQENLITVACDNILLDTTVPQGALEELETEHGNETYQTYKFDFFNYAGINRPVVLYTTPIEYIEDITVITNVINTDKAEINYTITTNSNDLKWVVNLLDQNGTLIVSSNNNDLIIVDNPNLWWPYLMNEHPGYMYNLEVKLFDSNDNLLDIYRQPIGIRSISWTNDSLLMNDKPLYLHGFGRHEDSDIRGRGLDLAMVIKDYNLIKWVGANAYRTSHYPYAEEIMDMADEMGIMIIDECPGVDISIFSETLMKNHWSSLEQLLKRDKNRPSVIAWSIANEPISNDKLAGEYFGFLANNTKALDKTRPITMSMNTNYAADQGAKYLDIISFNRYNAWYHDAGKLEVIDFNVKKEARQWREKYNKPVLMSEYGADTMEGMHIMPEYIWSEEFQVTLISKHFQAFDELRKEGWFIGEFIWNFADFKTAQTSTRVGGNKKGIFTRNRQPKSAAHHLRKRYWNLANELYHVDIPKDLYNYVSSNAPKIHQEL